MDFNENEVLSDNVNVTETIEEETSVTEEILVKDLFCTNCGHQINEGSNFCTNCGTNVERVVVQKPRAEKESKEKKKDIYIQTTLPLNFEEHKSVVEEELKKIERRREISSMKLKAKKDAEKIDRENQNLKLYGSKEPKPLTDEQSKLLYDFSNKIKV